jgi:hypothetical protein
MLNKQKLASEKNLTQYYTDSELFWENLIQNPHTNRDTTLILFRSLQHYLPWQPFPPAALNDTKFAPHGAAGNGAPVFLSEEGANRAETPCWLL